jgi:hypothetical protein
MYISIYKCNDISAYYVETFCIIKSNKYLRVGEGEIGERGNSALLYYVLYVKVTTYSDVLLSEFYVNELCVFPKNYQRQRNARNISVMFFRSSNA